MTTDFTSVVRLFFASVYRYIHRVNSSCCDLQCKSDVEKTVQEIKNIEAKVYDLIQERLVSGYNAYVLYHKQYDIWSFEYTGLDKCLIDKNVLSAYKQVIERICEYYSVVIPRNARIIPALKVWARSITAANFKLIFKVKNIKEQSR